MSGIFVKNKFPRINNTKNKLKLNLKNFIFFKKRKKKKSAKLNVFQNRVR